MIAKIDGDGKVLSLFHGNKGYVDDEGTQYPRNIFTLWSDSEINKIGLARFEELTYPSTERSTGFTDVFKDGRVTRTHTTKTYVPPVITDPTPTVVVKEAYTEIVKEAYTEDIPEVLGEDGKTVVTAATTKDHAAVTKDHAAVTEVNSEYDYLKLRKRDYEATMDDMIIALWEHVVENRPDVGAAIESKRQAVKTKFPK